MQSISANFFNLQRQNMNKDQTSKSSQVCFISLYYLLLGKTFLIKHDSYRSSSRKPSIGLYLIFEESDIACYKFITYNLNVIKNKVNKILLKS